MCAWCQTLVDGICYLIEGFSGQAGKAMRDASSNLPPEIRNKIPTLSSPGRNPSSASSTPSAPTTPTTPAATGNERPPQKSGPMQIFKNPQVAKAVNSVYADYRFRQYEKKGLLEQCIQQRNERLGENNQ